VLLEGGNMKKDKKKYNTIMEDKGKILFLIAVLVVLFTLVSYLIIYLFRYLLSINPNLQTLVIGNQDTWLSFFGSLFGGSLTLVALVLTFKYTDEQRREEKALAVMPICVGAIKDEIKVSDQLKNICIIEISNISDNLAKNIKIEKYTIRSFLTMNGVVEVKTHDIKQQEFDNVSNILQGKKSLTLSPYIPLVDQLERDDNLEKVEVIVHLTYQDIFDIHHYDLHYTVEFNLRIRSNAQYFLQSEEGKIHFVKDFVFSRQVNNHK
jgi:hypothetical protein